MGDKIFESEIINSAAAGQKECNENAIVISNPVINCIGSKFALVTLIKSDLTIYFAVISGSSSIESVHDVLVDGIATRVVVKLLSVNKP